jgi:hypothetical protein
MPLDPNIILQGQLPQLQNPLDVQQKAMTLKHLAQQTQLADQTFADDQNMRQAYKRNVTVGPDGKPTLNQAGVLSDLTQSNPMQAITAQKEFTAQDLAAKEQKMKALDDTVKTGKMLVSQIPTGAVPPDQKQAAWTNMLNQGKQLGMPNHDSLPPQYPGDDFVNNMKLHLMTAEDQLKQQNSDRDYAIKNHHEKTYEQDVQVKRSAQATQKQNQTLQQTQSMLESARGNPAVAQAQKDIYAASKFESLANLNGDPNKLNPAQVQLAAMEVAKIASGGVPTAHELQGLTPSSIPGGLAAAAQKFVNHPVAANQGAFVNAMRDYTTALKRDAQEVVKEKYGRVIESRRVQLGDSNYQTLQKQYMEPFTQKSAAPPAATVQMRDPKGNIRAVPADQVEAAKAAGGTPL